MNAFKRLSLPNTFHVTAFILWCFIALIFPLVSGIIEITQVLKCLIFLFVATCIGEYMTGWAPFIRSIPHMLRTGFSMIAGGTILFSVISFIPALPLLFVLLLLFVVMFLYTKNVTWKIDTSGVAAILPVCILLISVVDAALATSPGFSIAPGDYFFYDALVVSLSKTATINDSVFHTGIPINYQTLTFLFPATLSYVTGISAHVAMDGIFTPVMKVMSFSMLSASVVYLYSVISNKKDSAVSWKYYAGASIALLLLAPLHPLYLLKFNIKNFILLGEGYLLPMGSMGFAFSILLFGVLNYFFFSNEKKNLPDIALFVLMLASVAVTKAAMFFPLLAFYGLYAILILFTNPKDKRIIYLVLSLIGGVLMMKLFVGSAGGILKSSFTLKEGHFIGLFRDTMQKFNRPSTYLSGIVFFGIMLILWLGLKTIIFSIAFLSKLDYIKKVKPYIIACLGCIIVSILPGFFLKMLMIDEQGQILQNTTFDNGQFLRAGLFISTFVAVAALLLIWGNQSALKNIIFKGIVAIWFGLAGLSFMSGLLEPVPLSQTDVQWEQDVVKDFNNVHPKLMSMLSTPKYSGQVLVAKEIYPWWTCTKRGDASGYVCTLKSNYRNRLLEGLINDTTTLTRKEEIIKRMLEEGVDALVATPVNKSRFDMLVNDSIITKPANSNWIYKLKK
jgi:hypothetical protein